MKEPTLGEQLDLNEPLEVAKHHGGGGGCFHRELFLVGHWTRMAPLFTRCKGMAISSSPHVNIF